MASQRDEQGRARLARHVHAPASAVWASLADGWLYAGWVVGESRVRSVDLAWPAVAGRIQHSFGLWPIVIDDESMVLDNSGLYPARMLLLQAGRIVWRATTLPHWVRKLADVLDSSNAVHA